MSQFRFNAVKFEKNGFYFEWFTVENWDNVESDIMKYYCYTNINIGREEDVIIEWNERKDGGMVFLSDGRDNKWEFICDFR
tara:strand:+ start:816 stop:1058 length:243 start_codon:yes stop_codon:yes gene_type:complete